MKKNIVSVVFVSSLLGFSGCNDQKTLTPNGEIPSAFAQYAALYEGSFKGTMTAGDGLVLTGTNIPVYTTGILTLELNGLKPEISFVRDDGKGSDLIEPDCSSSVGDLEAVVTDKDSLKELIFAFNPNQCSNVASGTEFDVFVEMKNGAPELSTSIFLYQQATLPDPGSIASGPGVPQNITWDGTFSKAN